MRDIGEGTIRRIDWQELAPIVLLLRIFNTSTGLRVLFLSLIGILLTIFAGGIMMVGSNDIPRRSNSIVIAPEWELCSLCSMEPVDYVIPKRAKTNYLDPLIKNSTKKPVAFLKDPAKYIVQHSERSILLPWMFFSKTGSRFFSPESSSWAERVRSTIWLLIVFIIWLGCGGMICRTVALRLTIDQAESFGDLRRFMCRRGLGFFSSITIVTVGILFCLMIVRFCGWLFASVPFFNYILAILFPVPLFFGFLAVVLLVALWFGWSLLFAAVSVDGSDGFDAVSRLFSYIYQRPLHYLVYWFYSGVLGFLGYIFVSIFICGTVYITAHFGCFPVGESVSTFDIFRSPTETDTSFAANMAATWCSLLELLLPAYAFAWFWTSSVAIYLLLRRSVDATPFDEVYRLEKIKPKTVQKIAIKPELPSS